MSLIPKWRRIETGLYYFEQIWGRKPHQRRVVGIVDKGSGGWWYAAVNKQIDTRPMLRTAKAFVEEHCYNKSQTLKGKWAEDERFRTH